MRSLVPTVTKGTATLVTAYVLLFTPAFAQVRLTPPASWLKPADLPALAPEAVERLSFRLQIGRDGAIIACEARGARSKRLGNEACKQILASARYEPVGSGVSATDSFTLLLTRDVVVPWVDWGGAKIIGGSITDRDYPYAAVRNGEAGTVVAAYVINTQGNVENCKVVRSSGSAILDATTCKLQTERFRFQPPVGPDGSLRAVRALMSLEWSIPRR